MKIAIVGTAPASRQVAPWDDKSWTIWVCSPGNAPVAPGIPALPRVDIWFELHALAAIMGPENKNWAVPYLGWLRMQSFPIYMQEKNDLVPQAIVFPIRDIIKKFGRNWLSSSITMMGFLALMRGAKEIGFFGVDMAADQEHYSGQRAACNRFIEICEERKIPVHIPFESCLGEPPPIYGYYEATRMGRKLEVRKIELMQARDQKRAQIEQLTREVCHLDGAVEQNNYILRTFVNGEDSLMDLPTTAPAEVMLAQAVPDRVVPPNFDAYTASSAGLLLPNVALTGAAPAAPLPSMGEVAGTFELAPAGVTLPEVTIERRKRKAAKGNGAARERKAAKGNGAARERKAAKGNGAARERKAAKGNGAARESAG